MWVKCFFFHFRLSTNEFNKVSYGTYVLLDEISICWHILQGGFFVVVFLRKLVLLSRM